MQYVQSCASCGFGIAAFLGRTNGACSAAGSPGGLATCRSGISTLRISRCGSSHALAGDTGRNVGEFGPRIAEMRRHAGRPDEVRLAALQAAMPPNGRALACMRPRVLSMVLKHRAVFSERGILPLRAFNVHERLYTVKV